MLANHGPVVAGTSVDAAANAIEELEETAKLFLILRGSKVRLLTDEQVAALNPILTQALERQLMPKLAANLSMMFTEVHFLDRFAAAAAAGFDGVEFLFPYEFSPAEIAARLTDHGLSHVLFNLPPGDWASGERGMAALPGREKEFMAGLDRALEFALATGCKQLHAMAGNWPKGANWRDGAAVYVDNLRHAADRVAEHDIKVLIEPLNKRDNPGYFLNTTVEATAILKEVRRDNVKLQLDLYHCQITEGDLTVHMRNLAGSYAHVQIARRPGSA